jgi:hypothetical protein
MSQTLVEILNRLHPLFYSIQHLFAGKFLEDVPKYFPREKCAKYTSATLPCYTHFPISSPQSSYRLVVEFDKNMIFTTFSILVGVFSPIHWCGTVLTFICLMQHEGVHWMMAFTLLAYFLCLFSIKDGKAIQLTSEARAVTR